MRTIRVAAAAAAVSMLARAVLAQDPPAAELEQEVARLRAAVAALAAQLEGTAKPVNLARTSLCAVAASSVNGQRPLDDPFYGVLNLFDEGTNRHNGILYPYWLCADEPRPWVEVRFDVPVTVAAVEVEGGPAFSARLFHDGGGEESLPAAMERCALPTPRAGVRAVRVTFESSGRGSFGGVHELRILGFAPAGVEYRVEPPHVRLTREHASAVARARHAKWQEELLGNTREEVVERGDGAFEVRFFRGDVELLRVTVAERSVSIDPRVRLEAARSTGEAGR